MARQYHGRRIFQPGSATERAEREEQRFRRRHDRLHRMQLRHPDERDQRRGPAADVQDDDLADRDAFDDLGYELDELDDEL